MIRLITAMALSVVIVPGVGVTVGSGVGVFGTGVTVGSGVGVFGIGVTVGSGVGVSGTGVTVGSGVGVSGVGVSGTGVTVGSGSGVSGTGVGSAGSGVGSSDGTSGSDETSPVVSSPEELKSSELDQNSSDVYTVSSAANTGMDPDKIIPDASVRHINLVRYLFFIYLNCSLLSAAYSRPLFPEICISSIA